MISLPIMHDPTKSYRGRFAPSPTGPLHFGSLVAAVGSCLDARTRGGKWFVRMEDLDPPREAPGAARAILRTLEAYGFEWDGKVVFQSRRGAAYSEALARLEREHAVFRCACTRREISDSALSGDFVVRRADGLFAYQLSVVVDDFEQGITDVVRGSDLLASTPRQVLLQRLLGCPMPRYMHLPVAVNRSGEKLSKQTLARPLAIEDAPEQLVRALRFLGQAPPADLAVADVAEIWSWARPSWRSDTIPRQRSLPEPEAR